MHAPVEADQARQETRPGAGMAQDEELGEREATPDILQVLRADTAKIRPVTESNPTPEETVACLAAKIADHPGHREPMLGRMVACRREVQSAETPTQAQASKPTSTP
jgi:hypothetical protein